MDIRTISEDNIGEYEGLVDEDVAENMGRMYYRGIAGHDPVSDDPLSVLIWELTSVETDLETGADLKWIYAADSDYIEAGLRRFHQPQTTEKACGDFCSIYLLTKVITYQVVIA